MTSPLLPTSWRPSPAALLPANPALNDGPRLAAPAGGLLWVLLLRWRGLVPLVLLVFTVEPCLRNLSGHLKPVTAMGTTPGEALNWWVFPVLVLLLLTSLCPAERKNWQGASRESPGR